MKYKIRYGRKVPHPKVRFSTINVELEMEFPNPYSMLSDEKLMKMTDEEKEKFYDRAIELSYLHVVDMVQRLITMGKTMEYVISESKPRGGVGGEGGDTSK